MPNYEYMTTSTISILQTNGSVKSITIKNSSYLGSKLFKHYKTSSNVLSLINLDILTNSQVLKSTRDIPFEDYNYLFIEFGKFGCWYFNTNKKNTLLWEELTEEESK